MAHSAVEFIVFGAACHHLHTFFAHAFVGIGGRGIGGSRVDRRVWRGTAERAGNADGVFERIAVFHIQLGTGFRSLVALVKIFSGNFFLREIQLQRDLCGHVFCTHDGCQQLQQSGAIQVFHLLLLLQLCACQSQGLWPQHFVHQ